MGQKEKIHFWLLAAEKDWQVCAHLFDKRDYPYALFFGHLVLEKTLKALLVACNNQTSPFTHRLVLLAEKTGLELDSAQLEILEAVTDFNLESRYPDEQFTFHKKCTQEFTQKWLDKIEGIRTWLLQEIRS